MTRTARPAATRDIVPRPDPVPARPEWERLGDRALLALLLRHAPTDPDQLASKLIARFGSLAAAASADPCELARAAQTAPDALLDLGVLRELAMRLARVEASRRPVIASWSALQAYARAALAHRPREQFRVLFLDNRNTLMADEWVADGTVDPPRSIPARSCGAPWKSPPPPWSWSTIIRPAIRRRRGPTSR